MCKLKLLGTAVVFLVSTLFLNCKRASVEESKPNKVSSEFSLISPKPAINPKCNLCAVLNNNNWLKALNSLELIKAHFSTISEKNPNGTISYAQISYCATGQSDYKNLPAAVKEACSFFSDPSKFNILEVLSGCPSATQDRIVGITDIEAAIEQVKNCDLPPSVVIPPSNTEGNQNCCTCKYDADLDRECAQYDLFTCSGRHSCAVVDLNRKTECHSVFMKQCSLFLLNPTTADGQKCDKALAVKTDRTLPPADQFPGQRCTRVDDLWCDHSNEVIFSHFNAQLQVCIDAHPELKDINFANPSCLMFQDASRAKERIEQVLRELKEKGFCGSVEFEGNQFCTSARQLEGCHRSLEDLFDEVRGTSTDNQWEMTRCGPRQRLTPMKFTLKPGFCTGPEIQQKFVTCAKLIERSKDGCTNAYKEGKTGRCSCKDGKTTTTFICNEKENKYQIQKPCPDDAIIVK